MQSDPFKKMIHALKKFRERHGHPAMRALLQALAGVTAVKKVPRDKYERVAAAAAGQIDCAEEIRAQIKENKKVQARALAALNADEDDESESESEGEDGVPKSAPSLDETRVKAFAKMAAKSAAPKLDKTHARHFASLHAKARSNE